MAQNMHHDLIIIGSGPAGLTAGIYAGRARLKTLIVQGKAPGGQLMGTTYVNNWPGEKSILGPELMMKIQDHAVHAGCDTLPETIVSMDITRRPFILTTHRGKELSANALIIATGSVPRKLNCPGESEYWGKGVTSCAVCDAALYQDKQVVIVGGGDSAMEFVFALAKYTKKITVIHIRETLTAAPVLQQRLKDYSHVKFIFSSTVTTIQGTDNHVTGVMITDLKTNKQSIVPTDGVFLAIGLLPNSSIVKGKLELTEQEYIKVTKTNHTSIPGIFAAGDVIDSDYRQAISSAGSGCMAALEAERYLNGLGSK